MDEFREVFGDVLTETLSVKTFLKSTPKGATHADAVDVDELMIEQKTSLQIDSTGESKRSDTQIFAPLDKLPQFTPGSLVLLPDDLLSGGRWAKVITVSRFITVGAPAHGVVYCG